MKRHQQEEADARETRRGLRWVVIAIVVVLFVVATYHYFAERESFAECDTCSSDLPVT